MINIAISPNSENQTMSTEYQDSQHLSEPFCSTEYQDPCISCLLKVYEFMHTCMYGRHMCKTKAASRICKFQISHAGLPLFFLHWLIFSYGGWEIPTGSGFLVLYLWPAFFTARKVVCGCHPPLSVVSVFFLRRIHLSYHTGLETETALDN
jgi:hypothetical protein